MTSLVLNEPLPSEPCSGRTGTAVTRDQGHHHGYRNDGGTRGTRVDLAALHCTRRRRPTRVPGAVSSDWRQGLPVLTGNGFHLRELRTSDAASLFALLTTEEVARFISPPPTTVEGFEKFIDWTHRRRAEGKHVCFAVVPDGRDTAVGLIQFHALGTAFGVAEWGFALGSAYWGNGPLHGAARAGTRFRVRRRGGAANGGTSRHASTAGATVPFRSSEPCRRPRSGSRSQRASTGTTSTCGRSCRATGAAPRPRGAREALSVH